jgi:HD-GYP domain-containing protein (c-di-GMP phosphodiesterase class II)
MHSSRLILKLKAERNRKIRMLVPPFEHHMGYDHSGYPTVGKERKLSLFGRILTIADVYDAITSPRIYRPDTLSPDKALGEMMSRSGTQFDPVLLKIFVNMMGLYPVGTLLKLDTGETALVMHGTDGDRTRPMVQLLIRKDGQKFEKGEIVDLGEKHLQSNGFKRNIVKALHPSAMGIQPAEFLV